MTDYENAFIISGEALREETERKQREETDRIERERKERQEVERRQRIAKRLPYLQDIAAAVRTYTGFVPRKTHTATVDEETGKLIVDGIDCSWVISVDHMYERTSLWRSRQTDRLKITVGDYGNRSSFPQKKDGSFSYDKIALKLISHAYRTDQDNKISAQKKANTNVVAEFRTAHGLRDYSGTVTASAVADKPLFLKISIQGAMTVERATEIANTLKAIGIKLE